MTDLVRQPNGSMDLAEYTKVELDHIIRTIESLEKEKDRIVAVLKENMEKHGVKSIDNEYMTITYIEPTTRVSVDQKKLKEEHEEVYLECVKETSVKSSLRIRRK
jgi:predicted phage-related endonuclease